MSETTTEKPLLAPLELAGRTLRNRIALAPLTRARAGASRVPNALMATYYRQRAGAGLVITEATTISEQANGWVGSPGVYTDAQMEGWKQSVDGVHEEGGTIFLQLWHTGRASHSDFHGGAPPVSASAIPLAGDEIHTPLGKKPYETPRALETDELPGLVSDYVAAARRAREAGFDGVEVHSANGYLLDQFLQSKTNRRTDGYGGSIDNRFRLLREVVEAVSAEIGSDRVGVRLSPNGVFNDMGSTDFRETFLHAASELSSMNIAYLHVLDGLAFGFHEQGDPVTLEEARQVFDGVLIGNCGYTLETAEQAVTSGSADMIAIGRPYISNPDLVARYAHDHPLAESRGMDTWYGGGALGYTDYPTYEEANR